MKAEKILSRPYAALLAAYSHFRHAGPLWGVVLFVGLLAFWSVVSREANWDRWLDRFRPAPATTDPRGLVGRLADKAAGLEYLGDGRVALGEFNIRTFDPLTGVTLRTDFRLEGMTVAGDELSFFEFMAGNHLQLREQVMITIRSAEWEDFADPEKEMLGRKIVARVNRALGRPFLETVSVKDFSMAESVDRGGFVPVPEEAP